MAESCWDESLYPPLCSSLEATWKFHADPHSHARAILEFTVCYEQQALYRVFCIGVRMLEERIDHGGGRGQMMRCNVMEV